MEMDSGRIVTLREVFKYKLDTRASFMPIWPRPGIVAQIKTAFNDTDRIIDEINHCTQIRFSENHGKPAISFRPNLQLKYLNQSDAYYKIFARDHVADLLGKIGLVVSIDKSGDENGKPCMMIYVPLDNAVNLKIIRNHGGKFMYFYKSMLTPERMAQIAARGSK